MYEAGNLDHFLEEYCRIMRANRGKPLFSRNLGLALVRANQIDRAIQLWQEEVQRPTPDELALLNDMAWLRATHPNKAFRNGQEALKLAHQAVQETSGHVPEILDTLAAAYAEEGQFSAAQEECQRAIDLAMAQRRRGLAAAIQKRRERYRDGFRFANSARYSPAVGRLHPG